mgnify:CR=1 FL=1
MIYTKVKSIKHINKDVTYDIQTGNHNFIANGILAHNCLIFQESVMELAEIIGLFPKDQCDNVRRAIMKRDLSKGEAAIAEAKKMEDQFVDGAVSQGIKEETARQAYQNILFYSSYGFNKSHAIAYAIDSYMCAWLLTHYEKEWLTTYLESMSNNPDDKATAIGEIRKLGYKIVPIDVQYAGKGWTCIEGKKFMPSLLSCKGVGESAVEELLSMRPITDFKDMFWNADGSWRPSKFNSKALDALIKLGAFGSLDVVGSGKLFRSYKHMHDVMIVHKDEIKKVSKRDQYQGYNNFLRLIDEYAQKYDAEELPGEWTKRELADFQAEILGTVDVRMIIDDEIWGTLETKGIKSVDELEQGEKEVVWFVVNGSNLKRTKTGKEFLSAEVMGSKSKIERMNIWGWKSDKNVIKNLTLCIAEVEKNDFGASTTSWKLKTLGE